MSDVQAVSVRTEDQPAPLPNDSRPIWELVIEDMQARDRVGRHRYGVPLQANNGRDALRQAIEERNLTSRARSENSSE